jgi:hypothetical protein
MTPAGGHRSGVGPEAVPDRGSAAAAMPGRSARAPIGFPPADCCASPQLPPPGEAAWRALTQPYLADPSL